ncbi:DUF6308 family protein [Modestobacter lapidis]|nr:hypothetical protein [Modestobacter lapidis]
MSPRRRTRVRRSLAELQERAAGHLARYTAPDGYYGFATYDQSAVHDGPLTPADVLMANLLSLRLDWRDVVPLFAAGGTPYGLLRSALGDALAEARALPPLEDCTEEQALMPALSRANQVAYETPHSPRRTRRTWGPVTVSKVLHRLAPTVPLIDAYVMGFYAARWSQDARLAIRADLIGNREWLEPLAAAHPVRGEPMPLTRVADIAIWMEGTSS